MYDSWDDAEYQKTLLEITAHFDALFADSPDAIYITDPQLNGNLIVACNQAFLQLHNLRREDVIESIWNFDNNKTLIDLEKNNVNAIQRIEMLRRDRKIVHCVSDWEHPDGTRTPFESVIQLISLAGREMIMITDRALPIEEVNHDTSNDGVGTTDIVKKYLRHLVDGVVVYDPYAEGRPVVDCNQRYIEQTGYSRNEIVGKTILDFSPLQKEEEYHQWLHSDMEEYLNTLRDFKIQFVGAHRRKDGSIYSADIMQYLVREDGQDLLISIVRDLTEVNQTNALELDRSTVLELIGQDAPIEDILKVTVQMLEKQLGSVQCSVLLSRDKHYELGVAPQLPHEYSLLIEKYADELRKGEIGQCIEQFKPVIITDTETDARSNDPLLSLNSADRGCWFFPVISRKELLALLIVYSAQPRRPKSEEVAIINIAVRLAGIAIEQYNLTKRLAYQAEHDILTGLPNRLLFNDRLTQALAQSRRASTTLAVLFLDLDGFKHVNDTLGHAAGDILLKQVAARLQSCIRDSDTVARMGGDEFTLILRHLNHPHDTKVIAQKIIDAIKEPFEINDNELFITSSIGIALHPFDSGDAEALLQHSDAAMYRAKEGGKNRFELYEERLTEAMQERQELKSQLRQAMERNEFDLYYQPQIDLKTGRTVCLEALIRWKHPKLGMVLPLSFIPTAEESGIILKIGEWVLNTACRQLQQWKTEWSNLDTTSAAQTTSAQTSCASQSSTREEHEYLDAKHLQDIRISVNVSALQFGRSEFFESVTRALTENKLKASSLELEMTESVLMQNVEESVRQMQRLRSLGVRLSIDDFGTSYSSLSYLQKLPIEVLKIDRSFVKDVHHKEVSRSLLKAIVTMGHTLNLQVLAEGAEVPEEVETLRELNCDLVQGFIVTPPLPPQEVTNFLITNDLITSDSKADGIYA